MADLARFLAGERDASLHVGADGQPCETVERGGVLLPGSFNPIHDGHWLLAEAARHRLGRPVAFELSVANVDKPRLSADDVRRRLTQFAGRAAVWLTHAPRFVQKAKLFPGTTFVVGADTAARVVSTTYHDNDPARMLAALDAIARHGCSFLVACRADVTGGCLTLADLAIPADYRNLFAALPPTCFRVALSSTELRARGTMP